MTISNTSLTTLSSMTSFTKNSFISTLSLSTLFTKVVSRFFARAMIIVMSLFALNAALAGEHTEEEIRLEISYLAMQLLRIKDTDKYTIESKALVKPYIGICSKMKPKGIYLACVTPKHGAAKAGLKTGDIVLSINGISMANQIEYYDPSGDYWKITKQMQVGDTLDLVVVDGDKTKEVSVIVGSLDHPAYRLEISKNELSK